MSMNRVVIVGRLTKDADLRYTPQGTAVANFTVASNRPFKNQEGEQEADFINCVIWRASAESLATYTKKGSLIGVDGRLQSRRYDDKDGKTVFVTEVVAESVQFLDPKPKDGQSSSQGSNNQQTSSNQTQTSNQSQGAPIDISDDDLPF